MKIIIKLKIIIDRKINGWIDEQFMAQLQQQQHRETRTDINLSQCKIQNTYRHHSHTSPLYTTITQYTNQFHVW